MPVRSPRAVGGRQGWSRGAGNGTYVETLTFAGGYIGLKGEGAAVVNNLQVDDMTILRAS